MTEMNLESFIGKQIKISSGTDQRGVASKIELIIKNYIIQNYNGIEPKSVRAIEDIKVNNQLIDIKTRDIDRKFSMPNLISIERLKKILAKLKSKEVIIKYLFIDYKIDKNIVTITNIHENNIEDISWENLQISNLGLGQIQIKNAKNDIIKTNLSIDEWSRTFFIEANKFFNKQINKFIKRREIWAE